MKLDIEEFKLSNNVYKKPKVLPTITSIKQGDGWFIKGPLSGTWMSTAAKLGGSHTLHVALAIQYVSGLKRNREIILERFHLDRFGVKKDSTRRAMDRLKKAGLIDYVKDGQKFKVTVLERKGTIPQENSESAKSI